MSDFYLHFAYDLGITGHLTFPAGGVADLLGWAEALGRCLVLIKAEGEGIFLTGGEGCPRVFAESCDASKDAFWRGNAEILWRGEGGAVTVDPELVAPWLHPAAKTVKLQVILSDDGCFQAICGVSVEPAG